MNVMPNKAMITVTTADSKYSRSTVFGGPVGPTSTGDSRLRPLESIARDLISGRLSSIIFSLVMAGSLIRVNRRGCRRQWQATHFLFLRVHQFQRSIRRGCFSGFDRLAFSARATVIPLQLDMKDAAMWRTQRFDDRVLRARQMRGLQSFLQHRFWIRGGGRFRIRGAKLSAQRALDKFCRRTQSTVEKNRASNGFENICEQRALQTSATFFFAA